MNCRLCGSLAVKKIYARTQLNPFFYCSGQDFDIQMSYWHCEECGFIFQTNTFKEEQYNSYYKEHAPNNLTDKNQVDLFKQRLAIFDDVFAKDKHGIVLEVGGGNGDFIAMVSADKRIVIDPSEQARKFALEHYNNIEYYNDLNEFEGSFHLQCADILVLCHVLEHIQYPLQFIEKYLKFVKDGGALFIEVPSLDAFVSTKKSPCFPNLDIEHINIFSNQTLLYLLEKAGCAIEFIRTDTSTHFPIVQCVARKKQTAFQSLEYFKKHVMLEDKRFSTYSDAIKKIVTDGGKVLFWGCGRKLYQIFQNTSPVDSEIIFENTYLFDKNEEKSSTLFCGKKILTNEQLDSVKDKITHVAITAERITTALAISKEARSRIPGCIIMFIVEDIVVR